MDHPFYILKVYFMFQQFFAGIINSISACKTLFFQSQQQQCFLILCDKHAILSLERHEAGCARDYIPLISRVFGPYRKLRTEFFSSDLWPQREARGP